MRPLTSRQYRHWPGSPGEPDSDPLDVPIRSAECFWGTLHHAAEQRNVDPAQLRDQLLRECRPGQVVLLRHLHDGARALAESGWAIPRVQRELAPADQAALLSFTPAPAGNGALRRSSGGPLRLL